MSKIDLKNVDFETLIIHAGQEPDKAYGSLATPIYQTSTFCFETVEEGAAKFANQIPGFVYSRGGNPTTRAFELKCAAMEGGEDAVAAASGMGAVGSVMTSFLKPGDHAIFDTAVYGGTNYVASTNLPDMGVEVSRVDTGDLEAVKAAIRPNTKMIYFESPNNPMMKVTDIRAIKDLAGDQIRVVVDGTFAPPPVQHVLQLGADIVLHSITKYINGHGDALGGVVKRVPVMSPAGLVIDHVLTPIVGGKIEGGTPDKVLYYRCPDDMLRGFRVYAGDLLLVTPAAKAEDDRLMLIEYRGQRMVRKLLKLDGGRIQMQAFDHEFSAEVGTIQEVKVLGRCIKLERRL